MAGGAQWHSSCCWNISNAHTAGMEGGRSLPLLCIPGMQWCTAVATHLCKAAQHSDAAQMCEASRPIVTCGSLSPSLQRTVLCRYERRYIERWLSQGNLLCPATGLALQRPVALTSNLAMRRSIEDWAQRNAEWMLVGDARGPKSAPHQAVSACWHSGRQCGSLAPGKGPRQGDVPSNRGLPPTKGSLQVLQ